MYERMSETMRIEKNRIEDIGECRMEDIGECGPNDVYVGCGTTDIAFPPLVTNYMFATIHVENGNSDGGQYIQDDPFSNKLRSKTQ